MPTVASGSAPLLVIPSTDRVRGALAVSCTLLLSVTVTVKTAVPAWPGVP